MKSFLSFIIISWFLFACHSQNSKNQVDQHSDAAAAPIVSSVFKTTVDSESGSQNNSLATFDFDNAQLLSRTDFECKIFVYEGTLVIQLLKVKEEINISLAGTQLYNQTPYSGNFTLAAQEYETTAMVSIHVNDPHTGEKITTPMFFGGKTTLVQFNKDEIQIDIDALGGFYADMENTVNWKPIKGHVRAKKPMFYGTDRDLQKLFY